jgi:hypothetical protein
MSHFGRFVGIDWSGAKGASHRGIQVAEIEANSRYPRLKSAPNGRRWSRFDIIEYIGNLRDMPTLVGIDFAFSVPWDKDSEFVRELSDAPALWSLVDSICVGTPHLYAGPVWTVEDSPFRPFIFHYETRHKGERYSRENRRVVEKREGNAISVYHMAGPQVGASSFSGMRMLHHLVKSHGGTVAIWPFDKLDCTKTTVVEIYPSFFYRKAGARRPSSNDLKALNFAEIDKTLKYYRAEREIEDVYRSVDEVDALIAAAALSKLADEASLRIPAGADLDLREGWIFGV